MAAAGHLLPNVSTSQPHFKCSLVDVPCLVQAENREGVWYKQTERVEEEG